MADLYQDFHLQPLAGEWREGSSETTRPVVNPYSGEELVSIRLANSDDLGMAYRKAEAALPFGGEKNSGLGRFNGDWAIEEFSTVQWVSVQRTPRQYPF